MDSVSNFEWLRQLRYYWDLDLDNCVAKMALSTYVYGCEYLGACPRLVITPLTVRVSHRRLHVHAHKHKPMNILLTLTLTQPEYEPSDSNSNECNFSEIQLVTLV